MSALKTFICPLIFVMGALHVIADIQKYPTTDYILTEIPNTQKAHRLTHPYTYAQIRGPRKQD
jgi:hypothetical protein